MTDISRRGLFRKFGGLAVGGAAIAVASQVKAETAEVVPEETAVEVSRYIRDPLLMCCTSVSTSPAIWTVKK